MHPLLNFVWRGGVRGLEVRNVITHEPSTPPNGFRLFRPVRYLSLDTGMPARRVTSSSGHKSEGQLPDLTVLTFGFVIALSVAFVVLCPSAPAQNGTLAIARYNQTVSKIPTVRPSLQQRRRER
ncbi:hypothetical protein CEXT_147321 [Caerostris extrusa]|uniref:Transmembrane protein n=1 Tax=Caerostris extrusa TaxID=172846 RepID=A0AAV4SXC4_CAEEX|nr:hypothetical protein CEXT_147321 [Caerostris extrusa]